MSRGKATGRGHPPARALSRARSASGYATARTREPADAAAHDRRDTRATPTIWAVAPGEPVSRSLRHLLAAVSDDHPASHTEPPYSSFRPPDLNPNRRAGTTVRWTCAIAPANRFVRASAGDARGVECSTAR